MILNRIFSWVLMMKNSSRCGDRSPFSLNFRNPRNGLAIAILGLAFVSPDLRAQTTTIFSESFQPVQAAGWNGMSWNNGAATGVVPTTQFLPGSYAYTVYAYGGGASGWAVYNTPILAGLSEWSYQAKAKYDQSLFNGTPQPGYYGSGGLLISATGDMSGDFIWVGLNCDWGEFSPGVTFARPTLEYRLGGETGSRTLFPPEVDSSDAVRMSKGNALGPATLTASRTAGSPGTITFVVDSPVDGPRTATINFTGAAATALDNLKYVGFVNYFSQWEYDDVSVTDGGGVIYANDFENGGQPGWYTMGSGFWWVRGGPGATSGNFTFRNEAIGDGYAFYTAPVLTNTSTNWSYSGQAKWTGSTGVNPWYGVGGLVLSSDQYGSDYLWVGYSRGDYGDTNSPGSAWCYAFYDYSLDGVTGSGNFTAQGAFRDFPDSPPVGITLSREPGSNELTLVVETPLDGVQTNTITVATNAAAMLDSLQYVGLRNYFGAFQYGNLQVTTSGNLLPPSGLSYSPSSQTGTVGTAIMSMIPTVTGTVTGYSVIPTLPSGLLLDAVTGTISGTPSAASASATYTVTASNAAGSTTAGINLGVQSAYAAWAQGAPLDSTNLLLYAIGGASDPAATNGVASVTTVNSNLLSITAVVRTNDPSLAVSGQSALNLATGPWTTNDVSMTPAANQVGVPSGTQRQIFSTPHATNDTKKFLRLRTTLTP